MSTHMKKSAPVRSSLLTKHIRGTLYLSSLAPDGLGLWFYTGDAVKTATAVEDRSDRSTSTVKSTCPGVSMMLICGLSSDRWWQLT